MKALYTLGTAAILLAGCASSENGTVYYRKDGTKVYGLDEQPQSAIEGQGSMMVGAYGTHTMPTGQFTGKERTNDRVAETPITPREADPREFDHSPKPVNQGIVPPSFTEHSGVLGSGTPPVNGTNTVIQTDIETTTQTNSVPNSQRPAPNTK